MKPSVVRMFTLLQSIRETPGRNEKEKILLHMLKRDEALTKDIFKAAMYPFWNYGVTVNERAYLPVDTYVGDREDEKSWQVFSKVLKELREGKLSGDAARLKVKKTLARFSRYCAHWLMSIANKNLRIGLSHRTIKKHIPGLLPETEPMLCDVYDAERHQVDGWYIEPKLDGMRCLAIIENRKITWLSRSHKPIWNTEVIEEQLLSFGVDNAVFDGELKARTFSETMQILRKQTFHPLRGKVVFTVFDVIPLGFWNAKKSHSLDVRRNTLMRLFDMHRPGKKPKVNLPNVKPISFYVIDKGSNIKLMIKRYVRDGHEGVVMKNPASEYQWGRSKDWLKGKPIYEDDFKIFDVTEGNGKFAGMAGALWVSNKIKFKGKEYDIKAKVSGLTEKDRKDFLKRHKAGKLKNVWVRVEFGDVTKNKQTGEYSLRFPEFDRERTDI